MKDKLKITFYIFNFTFLILFSCTQPNPQNPFDPQIDISVSNLQYEKLAINKIKLTWENEITTDAGVIRIDKKVGSASWQEGISELASDETSWTDNDVDVNQNLIYRISVIFSENQSEYDETEIIDNTIPTPQNLTFQNGSNDISLTWEYDMNGISGFAIARKMGSEGWNDNYATVDANILEWSDTGLDPETYYYKVQAYYSTYYSAFSNYVQVNITDVPTEGLVAYYPFNGNANDESGNGNNGEINGPVFTLDRFNENESAIEFDGFNDNINLFSDDSIDYMFSPSKMDYSFSISTWFYTYSLTPQFGYYPILHIGYSSPSWQFNLGIRDSLADTKVYFGSHGFNEQIYSTNSTSINQWYHVVAVYNGLNHVAYLYINGTLNTTMNITNGDSNCENQNVYIGYGQAWGSYFDGKIDDLRIYNRALIEEEIQVIYYEGGWN